MKFFYGSAGVVCCTMLSMHSVVVASAPTTTSNPMPGDIPVRDMFLNGVVETNHNHDDHGEPVTGAVHDFAVTPTSTIMSIETPVAEHSFEAKRMELQRPYQPDAIKKTYGLNDDHFNDLSIILSHLGFTPKDLAASTEHYDRHEHELRVQQMRRTLGDLKPQFPIFVKNLTSQNNKVRDSVKKMLLNVAKEHMYGNEKLETIKPTTRVSKVINFYEDADTRILWKSVTTVKNMSLGEYPKKETTIEGVIAVNKPGSTDDHMVSEEDLKPEHLPEVPESSESISSNEKDTPVRRIHGLNDYLLQ